MVLKIGMQTWDQNPVSNKVLKILFPRHRSCDLDQTPAGCQWQMKVHRDSLLQNLIALVVTEQTYDNLFIGNNRLTLAFESSFAVVFQHGPSSADLTIL